MKMARWVSDHPGTKAIGEREDLKEVKEDFVRIREKASKSCLQKQ
ncbi:hypothetical protein MF1_10880 [Bartonella quintana]|nr:hypothetical protein MF1_10880 [Bartonella quintana]